MYVYNRSRVCACSVMCGERACDSVGVCNEVCVCSHECVCVCVAGFLVSDIGGFIQQGVRSSGGYQPVCASCVWLCVCVARV